MDIHDQTEMKQDRLQGIIIRKVRLTRVKRQMKQEAGRQKIQNCDEGRKTVSFGAARP